MTEDLTISLLALYRLFVVWSVLGLDCCRRAKWFGWQIRYGVMAMALYPRGTLVHPLAPSINQNELTIPIIPGSYYWLRCPNLHLCPS